MWVETVDGFIINSDTLEKIAVELYSAVIKVESKRRIDMDRYSPEEKEQLKKELNNLMEHTKSNSIRFSDDDEVSDDEEVSEDEQGSEDIYEIRGWTANGKDDPYIFFRGGKNVCECKFTEFKRKLGYIHAW